MRKTFKYRLYPKKEQLEKIQFTLERCGLLYNRLLDERRFAYKTDKTTLNYYYQANTLNERSLLLKSERARNGEKSPPCQKHR